MRADDCFLYLPAARLTFFVREGHPPQCEVFFPSRSDHIGFSGPFPSCGPILCSRTPNELLVMSTSHADFLSTLDLSLCARTVAITRGPLPVACGPFPSPFSSRGPLPSNAHTYTHHARTAVFSLTDPQRTFSDQIRLACGLSTSGPLCFARGPFHVTDGPLAAASGPFAFQ